ncbi:hypothetical protein [Arenimonas sp.]|uniref:hypothetical protein n=1 Tax=Arenimonas sp. TaxID=1872635 RepID=UPI0039E689D1
MKPEAHNSAQLRPLERKVWTAVFRISGLVLVCCMVAIVGFPDTVGYSWVYWAAMGSALVCGVAAAILRKLEGEEARVTLLGSSVTVGAGIKGNGTSM